MTKAKEEIKKTLMERGSLDPHSTVKTQNEGGEESRNKWFDSKKIDQISDQNN